MGIIFDEKIPRTFRFCRGRFGRQKNSFAARSEMEKDGVSCVSCKSMGISGSGSVSIRGRGLMLLNAMLTCNVNLQCQLAMFICNVNFRAVN